MRTMRELERAALTAHTRGIGWMTFWPSVAQDVNELEPISIARHRRLAAKLMGLVVSGDLDGRLPPGASAPWVQDDQVQDTATQARYQGTLPIFTTP